MIFAGKAHLQDREGKALIQRIFAFRNALRNDIRIGYLERYDMELAKLLTAGADLLWLAHSATGCARLRSRARWAECS